MLEIYDMQKETSLALNKINELGHSLDIEYKRKEIIHLTHLMGLENFWDNPSIAKKRINRLNELKDLIEQYDDVLQELNNFNDELNLLREEYSLPLHEEVFKDYEKVFNKFNEFEINSLLSDSYDHLNAMIEIHPGAGGVESQDFALMLYRMYTRYASKKGFSIETLDYEEGQEAGIKSVSFIVKGKNTFGYLKGESGVHRLVRISPFDANKRRHTSFASVDVIPELVDNDLIVINEEDLRIDTYRASGAGGQHINKTDSAVRLTHLPTGIVVTCQSQRSQIQNKEKALLTLKAKLYQRQLKERENEVNAIRGEQKNIEWGSQIRSYVFCPYNLAKDNRSGYETSQVFNVLDGDLDDFIFAYLKMGAMKNDNKER
ncbi:MAG: peptide chain release factor 2 [Bacilli bacterium]|nr:peptide chain release factor 2 [Bacilli bacterium]